MSNSIILGRAAAVLALCVASCRPAAAQHLEIELPDRTVRGLSVLHNRNHCWLELADGRYEQLTFANVQSFQRLPQPFRPLTTAELAEQLRGEVPGLKVGVSGRYAVAAPASRVRAYAALLDDVYRSVRRYFALRGFAVEESRHALSAVIFEDRAEYLRFAASEGIQAEPLAGYYLPRTNRVVMYERVPRGQSLSLPHNDRPTGGPDGGEDNAVWGRTVVDTSLRDTLVHEATHQVCFNLGLHARLGDNPRWLVEGLAIVLETEDNRVNPSSSPRLRANRARLFWYADYQQRKPSTALEDLIATDQPFQSAPLDAYAHAWALSFYLSEQRTGDYRKYLGHVARRANHQIYPPADRLQDFRQFFGKDLSLLEAKADRFIDSLR